VVDVGDDGDVAYVLAHGGEKVTIRVAAARE
jgi:hypothetical protein